MPVFDPQGFLYMALSRAHDEVVNIGSDLAVAQRRAYEATRAISWDGVHYRSDIGHRGIARRR